MALCRRAKDGIAPAPGRKLRPEFPIDRKYKPKTSHDAFSFRLGGRRHDPPPIADQAELLRICWGGVKHKEPKQARNNQASAISS
jgi:hypothetical protein